MNGCGVAPSVIKGSSLRQGHGSPQSRLFEGIGFSPPDGENCPTQPCNSCSRLSSRTHVCHADE